MAADESLLMSCADKTTFMVPVWEVLEEKTTSMLSILVEE
jgi:hypothetical protein